MQKEIARRLMKKQWVQNLLQEDRVREIFEDWTILMLRQGLKPEGKARFDDFVNSIQKGEQIALSSYIDMFIGFDFKSGIRGLENLVSLKGKPILLVANHPNNGPLAGDWKNIVISYYIQQELKQELRDLHGYDPTTIRDLFRMKGQKSTNSIPVRDPDPQRSALLLRQAIKNRDSMRLYPEGDGDISLRRGLTNAGRLIAICARNGMAIVTASARFQKDIFFVAFDRLDNEDIERSAQDGNDKYDKWQNITDYTMGVIAKHLPANHRGYYSYITT